MFTQNKDTFSEIIDITLYKYNSIDLKLWGLLKRHYNSKYLNNNSILISANDFKKIINKYFYDDLNRIDAIGENLIHKEATTIYFTNKVFNMIQNIKWLKVNINKNMQYNRIVNINQIKTIKFSIKTIRGTFKLFDHFNSHQINILNKLFIKMCIFNNNEYFKVIKTQDLLNKIDIFLKSNNTIETHTLLNAIINYFEAFEVDNPEILLITDIESDI